MKIKGVVAAALCAVAWLVVGCAESYPPIADTDAAQESFRQWMAKFDPLAERHQSGIYLRFIERGAQGANKPKAELSWLRVDYTLYSLSGIVGESRNEEVSRLLGKWQKMTRYVDDWLPYPKHYSRNFPQVCQGLIEAFGLLRQGDSVRIYIPSNLGYSRKESQTGMNVNLAYGGESLDYIDKPCYFDLRLHEVIDDAAIRDSLAVAHYARDQWGQTVADTVTNGIYVRILEDPEGSTQITKDSTVRYFHATRFLDGHLMRSNVTKVVTQAGYYYPNSSAFKWSTKVVSFMPQDFEGFTSQSDSANRVILSKVFLDKRVKAGQTIEWVSVSGQIPFGRTGFIRFTPQILPFEARRMQMRLLRWDEKPDQSLYTWDHLY